MKVVDTLIVGFGIAGLNYAEQLRRHNKSFVVMAPEEESASHLAAGIVNPTVLKHFNPVWKAANFLDYALPFYSDLEERVQSQIIHSLPIYRILNDIQEQNDWRVAASSTSLEKYLNKQLISEDKYPEVSAPFAFGEVIQSARVDTKRLLSHYIEKVIPNQFIPEKLDYRALIHGEFIEYKDIKVRQIVFCEGYDGLKNPNFNYLPLIGSKGEVLTIKCEQLTEQVIFKGPIFLSPMGNKTFWVGATFNRKDKTTRVSEEGKAWLLSKLKQFLKHPFQILEHKAQIRATVVDRRPLLGRHPKHDNVYLLNGLGTRGVLMSPLLSDWLFQFIENKEKLPPEADIKRFEKQYFRNL
jgi:glycine/D-amino acid oxidase-like deaminating enzyme